MSEADPIVITCPSCGGRLRTSRAAIGTSVGCPSCQSQVPVRDPAAFTPVPMIFDSKRKLGQAPRGESAPVSDTSFKDRLRRTTEAGLEVDPEHPVMIRRDLRKAKHGETLTDWDRQSRRPHRHRKSKRPLYFLGGLAALLLVLLTGIFWQRVQRPDPSYSDSAAIPLELQPQGDFREQVWEVIRQFSAAPNPEALLPLIREPERVGPKLLAYYNQENPWVPLTLGKRPDLSELEVHRSFVVLQLPLSDFTNRPIALEQTPDGFRVDWESFTGYSELSWAELRRTRPSSPVVLRAVIRPSDYFNRDFPSPATHRSYQITDLHSDHVLYGYVPKGSDVEIQIAKILLTAPNVHAVIRVRYPENSTNDRQLEITEILEKGWIFREDDIPESLLEVAPLDLTRPPVQESPGTVSTKPALIPRLSAP